MPARLLEGEAAAWEAGLSALLLLGTALLAVRVGERLYRASLLRARGKITGRRVVRTGRCRSLSRRRAAAGGPARR